EPNYAVSVGGTTGVSYGTNVGNINLYSNNEDPIPPETTNENNYGTVPGELTNIGIVTSTSEPFVPFELNEDNTEPPVTPLLRLEISPSRPFITAGDSITIRYFTQYANRIVYSNFGATNLGRTVNRNEEENLKMKEGRNNASPQ
ncbi:MAG: hypothetical protein ACO3UU_12810, partial [Minisyncoccia bacterium]